MKQAFEQSNLARDVQNFRCPRWAELPTIELYMDQLTGYINSVFGPLNSDGAESPLLTKAMVNNYVKQRVIERPTNKKYGKSQLAQLIAICALKQVFSIPDICVLLRVALEHDSVQHAYDYFCDELEGALAASFGGGESLPPHSGTDPEQLSQLVRRAAQAWASKIYVQKRIEYLWQQREKGTPCS